MRRIYQSSSLQSLFKRSQLAIFTLTFSICTIIFVVLATISIAPYTKRTFVILGDALSERIQPAVVFNDKLTINQIIKDYSQQYSIQSIKVLNAENQEIAHTSASYGTPTPTAFILDYLFFQDPVRITIRHQQKIYGQILLCGSSSNMVDYFHKILLALFLSLFIILLVLFWFVRSTYQYLMTSIHPVVETAKIISQDKNYQLRLPNSPIKELQDINIVFNELLEKIQYSNQQLQIENDKLFHQAKHDGLTLLPNRNYFYQILFQMYNQSPERYTVLMFIDNNNFKSINDQYGHLAGDAVLKEMAYRLKKRLRSNDFIARLGGDEFAILLKNVEQSSHVISISENLLSCCQYPISYENVDIYFSFSIGIAFFKCHKSPEDLIASADSAMYTAKTLQQRWYIAPCKEQQSENHV